MKPNDPAFKQWDRGKHKEVFDTASAGFHFGILKLGLGMKKRKSRRRTNSLKNLQKECYIDGHFPLAILHPFKGTLSFFRWT